MLVDAGADVGLPYLGNAPDLGYFGSPYSRTTDIQNSSISIQKPPTVFPNLYNSKFTFLLPLNNPSNISISIYNIAGLKVASFTEQFYPKGTIYIDFNGDALANGIYISTININGKNYFNKLIVTGH